MLQKQIEDLIADNIDNQKRIHGEVSYLNTGEYPTDDLNDRLMPMFTLRSRSPVSCKKIVNPIEKYFFIFAYITFLLYFSIVDVGLNSSPDEDEENPSVVDVPQRFWNWTREYLRHINVDYVSNFKKKIVDRFSKETFHKYLDDG